MFRTIHQLMDQMDDADRLREAGDTLGALRALTRHERTHGDCSGCGKDHEEQECPYLDRDREPDWDLQAKDAEVMACDY